MQFAKDSFSMALRERLAALNPARTVTVSGAQRPAVVVLENEMPNSAELLTECFYLEWSGLSVSDLSSRAPMCSLDCRIRYRTCGSVESRVDRGRVTGQLDRELLQICRPVFTKKLDFSRSPNVELGTGISWSLPLIETWNDDEDSDVALVEHRAQLKVFFFPEVGSL